MTKFTVTTLSDYIMYLKHMMDLYDIPEKKKEPIRDMLISSFEDGRKFASGSITLDVPERKDEL